MSAERCFRFSKYFQNAHNTAGQRPEIEPTNNRAERGLRGAVIARKVSHCSKNERGAGIYEAMKSVTASIALRGQGVVTGLANLIMGHPMQNVAGR